MQNFSITQPIITEGWTLVVKTSGTTVDFMSWTFPFSTTLWIIVAVEIGFAAFVLCLCEGYGTNENVWISNYFAMYYDCFYW